MISLGLLSVLGAGLLMGILHAFDPDHVMTMSSLGSRPDARGATARYALSWGVGHGGILMVAALALLLFDVPMPETLPKGAERFVGVILIAAGGSLALALWRSRTQGEPPSSMRAKAPFLIGMVHGTAGSAAVFALLPVGLLSPLLGVIYVLVFSSGVLIGMIGFGHGLDRLQALIAGRLTALDRPLRGGVAVLAISMGSYWLVGA
jgi:nickel/cobalt transporter (NicO) family protein